MGCLHSRYLVSSAKQAARRTCCPRRKTTRQAEPRIDCIILASLLPIPSWSCCGILAGLHARNSTRLPASKEWGREPLSAEDGGFLTRPRLPAPLGEGGHLGGLLKLKTQPPAQSSPLIEKQIERVADPPASDNTFLKQECVCVTLHTLGACQCKQANKRTSARTEKHAASRRI